MEKERTGKRRMVVCRLLGAGLTLLLLVYISGVFCFQRHFLPGTRIDQADVSCRTPEELQEQVDSYFLRVLERKQDGASMEETIRGSDIGLRCQSPEALTDLLRRQDPWLWFLPNERVYQARELLVYDEQALKGQMEKLKGFQEGFAREPVDACLSEYTQGQGFAIQKEQQGNLLEEDKTWQALCLAVEELQEVVDLDAEECYQKPRVTEEDPGLQRDLAALKAYEGLSITYNFGEQQEVLDGATICGWLSLEDGKVQVDTGQVQDYVATLRKRYDTIFRPRSFQTSYGTQITIDSGDYGWWMNYGQEALELEEMILRGESGERTPVYYQTAASYGVPDYGNSYVEINLTAQHLFVYLGGELQTESDFVSGNVSRGYHTPSGVYGITYKQRNATLEGETYSTPVKWWMPFNKNIGMHDASWRATFGGDIYKTGGSHGCINLPPKKAEEIYGLISKGTPVIVYELAGTAPSRAKPSEEPQSENQPESQPVEASEPVETGQ